MLACLNCHIAIYDIAGALNTRKLPPTVLDTEKSKVSTPVDYFPGKNSLPGLHDLSFQGIRMGY